MAKFRDIPKFIQSGSYSVDMALDFYVRWLEGEKAEAGLELNPDFQRGHVWTENQQIAFIEYLLRGGRTTPIFFNCPHYCNGEVGHEFVCVDGLQRTTAIQRFIYNEIPAFGHYYREYEDKLPIHTDIHVNINELPTKKNVLQWYLELNTGGTPHTDKEIERVKLMYLKEYFKEMKKEPDT